MDILINEKTYFALLSSDLLEFIKRFIYIPFIENPLTLCVTGEYKNVYGRSMIASKDNIIVSGYIDGECPLPHLQIWDRKNIIMNDVYGGLWHLGLNGAIHRRLGCPFTTACSKYRNNVEKMAISYDMTIIYYKTGTDVSAHNYNTNRILFTIAGVVTDICPMPNGNLVCSTHDSIDVYHKSQRVQVFYDEQNWRTVAVDQLNRIYAATPEKILIYSQDGNLLTTYNLDSYICSMVIASDRLYVLSCKKGLQLLEPR